MGSVVRPRYGEVSVPSEDERSPAEPGVAEVDTVADTKVDPDFDVEVDGEVDSTESSQAIAGVNGVDGDVPVAEISESPDLAALVGRLAGEVAGLQKEFKDKIRYDEVKERQIDRMHEELQGFRTGLHLRLLQPVFTDLIAMHDDLVEASHQDNASADLDSFKESILETLLRNGVSSYIVDSNEIDRARQRVIRAVTTSDETLDRHVQRRVRVGFEYDNGKVLRPEWVVAYRHAPNAEEAAPTPVTGGE
jgi:molecular chaperone GrpE (heat shock protein)